MFHKRTSLVEKKAGVLWMEPGLGAWVPAVPVPACLYHPPAAVLRLEMDFRLQSEYCPLRPLHLAREDALWTVHSTRSLNEVIAQLVWGCFMVGCLLFHFCPRYSLGPRPRNSCERWNYGVSLAGLFSCFMCSLGLSTIFDMGQLSTNLKS